MRTLLLLLGSGVLLLLGFAVVRTVGYGSAPPVLVPAADIAAPPGAAGRLAGSLRIPTISHEEPAAFDAGAFRALHTYLQMAFPRAHAELQRETVAMHSLLYAWRGRDPSLKPILLAGHLDVVPVEPGTEKNWQEDPFGGQIADGFIWGRGAIDNKFLQSQAHSRRSRCCWPRASARSARSIWPTDTTRKSAGLVAHERSPRC